MMSGKIPVPPYILIPAVIMSLLSTDHESFSQSTKNWQLQDNESGDHYGMSVDKLHEYLKGQDKPREVIVAIIDSGTEIDHDDLKEHIWVNRGEVPSNGIDDDNNGYVDDLYGWNFLGPVRYGNLESTRLVREYENNTVIADTAVKTGRQLFDEKEFLKLKMEINGKRTDAEEKYYYYIGYETAINEIEKLCNTTDPTESEINAVNINDTILNKYKLLIMTKMRSGKSWAAIEKDVNKNYEYYLSKFKYHYNLEEDPRDRLGDLPHDYKQVGYGTNEVEGPEASHGTHVSGIVAASRNDDYGTKGVSANCKLMILRAVPDGDEHDKDVANAIRYAVDHGARVINMSFSKEFSPGKSYVDDAVRYAELKDVIIVHGSGNDGQNSDKKIRYPNRLFENNETASNWIEVGASTMSGEAAYFSNYGKKNVDVFAPGVKIYSTTPDNGHESLNGTSMSSPAVAGIAAILRGYFPQLSAKEIKEVIISSVSRPRFKTTMPGTKRLVGYRKLCVSGGVVNAYKAFKLAETY